jgi:hypothetical protein
LGGPSLKHAVPTIIILASLLVFKFIVVLRRYSILCVHHITGRVKTQLVAVLTRRVIKGVEVHKYRIEFKNLSLIILNYPAQTNLL